MSWQKGGQLELQRFTGGWLEINHLAIHPGPFPPEGLLVLVLERVHAICRKGTTVQVGHKY